MTNKTIKHTIKGTLSWKVEKDGQTLRQSCTYNNMILNQGLDFIAEYSFADCFNYCVVGSVGTAPVRTDTGLGSEVRRTNNCSAAVGANGAALSTNIFTLTRTFIFPAIEVPNAYREVGFSPFSTAGNNLFSKALLKDSLGVPVTVNTGVGETLTVRYDLSIEIFDASTRVRNGIEGRSSSDGYVRMQKVGLKGISALGVTENYDDALGVNEPSVQSNIFVSTNGAAPEPFGSCLDRSPVTSKVGSLSNYVEGSYVINKGVLLKPSETPATVRSAGVGTGPAHGSVFVFDSDQTPGAGKAYFLNFTYAWVHQNSSNFSEWLDGDDYLYLNKRLNKLNSYAYFAL
jgi:hypothetical protein